MFQVRPSLAIVLAVLLSLILTACAPAATLPLPAPTLTPAPATPKPQVAPTSPKPISPTASPTPVSRTPVQTAPPMEQPVYGGILKRPGGIEPSSFDFMGNSSGGEIPYFPPLYNGLLQLDPIGWQEVIPDLAQSWEVSPDGKKWTFKLWDNIKAHDGVPFTSDDVVYNLNRILRPPKGVRTLRQGSFKDSAASVEAPDARTVVVTLKEPDVAFLQVVAQAWMMIHPRHIAEPLDSAGKKWAESDVIGTGPFKVKKISRGASYEYVRNENYFIKGRPYLDGITYYVMPDAATRMAAFQTKRIHMTSNFPRIRKSDVDFLKEQYGDRVKVGEFVQPQVSMVHFNRKVVPWNDIRLREAADLAFDRQEVIQLLFKGAGLVKPPLFFSWMLPSEDWWLQQPGIRADKTQDLARARQLVNEVTKGKGVTGAITVRDEAHYAGLVELLVEQWKKVGINLSVRTTESRAGYEAFDKRDFEVAFQGSAGELLDPSAFITTVYLPGASRNYVDWENEEFIRLHQQQRVERDVKRRGQILFRMVEILLAEKAWSYAPSPTDFIAWWAELKNYHTPPLVHHNQKFEHMWLASR